MTHLIRVQLGLTDPDAPHGDNDHGVAADQKQVDAEEQEVEDVSYVTPLVQQLALLLHRQKMCVEVLQVLTDQLQLGQRNCVYNRGDGIQSSAIFTLKMNSFAHCKCKK